MSDDQLQADSENLQEFNLSSALSVLSIFIVLILRFRLDFRLMAPAQSCSEETFRQSGTWSTAQAGTAWHRSWCPASSPIHPKVEKMSHELRQVDPDLDESTFHVDLTSKFHIPKAHFQGRPNSLRTQWLSLIFLNALRSFQMQAAETRFV